MRSIHKLWSNRFKEGVTFLNPKICDVKCLQQDYHSSTASSSKNVETGQTNYSASYSKIVDTGQLNYSARGSLFGDLNHFVSPWFVWLRQGLPHWRVGEVNFSCLGCTDSKHRSDTSVKQIAKGHKMMNAVRVACMTKISPDGLKFWSMFEGSLLSASSWRISVSPTN